MPVAQPMQATCTDNYDEEQGTGRIQVQFHFEEKACYHWIRTMTPDAGKGVGKNRGYIAVPEKGDEVILGFMDGNPEKPFVMGSVFHTKNGENIGGEQGNHIMSIRDKSGSEAVFNDKEGSIKLYSPKGKSTVFIDGKGNISVNTPATISLSSKDIKLNASNTICFTSKPEKNGGEGIINAFAEKSIDITAENEGISVQAKTEGITLKAKTDFKASSENADLKLQAAKELKMEGEDIKTDASGTIRISSSDTDII